MVAIATVTSSATLNIFQAQVDWYIEIGGQLYNLRVVVQPVVDGWEVSYLESVQFQEEAIVVQAAEVRLVGHRAVVAPIGLVQGNSSPEARCKFCLTHELQLPTGSILQLNSAANLKPPFSFISMPLKVAGALNCNLSNWEQGCNDRGKRWVLLLFFERRRCEDWGEEGIEQLQSWIIRLIASSLMEQKSMAPRQAEATVADTQAFREPLQAVVWLIDKSTNISTHSSHLLSSV